MAFGIAPWWLIMLWLLWGFQAIWSVANLRGLRQRAEFIDYDYERRTTRRGHYTPPTAVIVPIKGVTELTESHFRALLAQDYPRFRLVFVVECTSDPAHAAVERLRRRFDAGQCESTGCGEIDLIVAGSAEQAGQKVHNQLAALAALRDDDEAVAFADADIVPHERWLRRLIEPLRDESKGVSTGYRWMTPMEAGRPSLATTVACVINASVACLLGPRWRNHAWGGSMAVRRETIERVDLAHHWQGALSDDYQLTCAVRRAGLKVFFVPACLIASPVRFTWRSLLEFGRRQYVITRMHAPYAWLAALIITTLYLAATAATIAALIAQPSGWAWGLVVGAVVIAADAWRAKQRKLLIKQCVGEAAWLRLRSAHALERYGTLLCMAVHLVLVLSATFARRITWGGITYRIRGPRRIDIIDRADAPAGDDDDADGDRHGEPRAATIDDLHTLPAPLAAKLADKRLIFTVTTGRSGTMYLGALCERMPGVAVFHEPAPDFVEVMRDVQRDATLAEQFWIERKLPVIARVPEATYLETSHLFGKGFAEPLLELDVAADLILLSRPARQVARSLCKLGTIPGRTELGLRYYLSPDDPVLLPLSGWAALHDYQLCYWYCLETQRRQRRCAELYAARGRQTLSVTLDELNEASGFERLWRFVTGEAPPDRQRQWFEQQRGRPENIKSHQKAGDAELPDDRLDAFEREVHERIADAPLPTNAR